jgi:hypothetical protein
VSVPKPIVTIEGPSTASLGETTFFKIISQNAVRGEWSIGGFQNNQTIPVKPLAPSHQIQVQPTDPTRVGNSFVVVFTAYNKAGEAAVAEERFVVGPPDANKQDKTDDDSRMPQWIPKYPGAKNSGLQSSGKHRKLLFYN